MQEVRKIDAHGKEINPRLSVEQIKTLLKQVGGHIVQTPNIVNHGVHSGHIDYYIDDDKKVLLQLSNGKGISEEYHEGSLYGELLERICNFAFFVNNARITLTNNKGFYFDRNEKFFTLNELKSQHGYMGELFNYNGVRLYSFGYMEYLNAPKDKYLCVPVKNVVTGESSYSEFGTIYTNTTGMCAGNTREEALNQGIFEFFERYSQARIIYEGLEVPFLSKDIYKNTFSSKVLDEITSIENGRFKVKVYDCSLDTGVPIVGILVTDKSTRKYKVSFGSAHTFNLALERSITELFQNADIYTTVNVSLLPFTMNDPYLETFNSGIRGENTYPEIFFYCGDTIAETTEEICLGDTQIEIHENLKRILTDLDINVYYLDNSFLGLHAYQLFSPKLEYLHIGMDMIKDLETFKDFPLHLLDSNLVSPRTIPKVLKHYEREWGALIYCTGFIDYVQLKGITQLGFVSLVKALCYLVLDDISNFIRFASIFVSEFSDASRLHQMTYFDCLLDVYRYVLEGYDILPIIGTLSNFYDHDILLKCTQIFGNYSEIIKFFGFFNIDGSGIFNLISANHQKTVLDYYDNLTLMRDAKLYG